MSSIALKFSSLVIRTLSKPIAVRPQTLHLFPRVADPIQIRTTSKDKLESMNDSGRHASHSHNLSTAWICGCDWESCKIQQQSTGHMRKKQLKQLQKSRNLKYLP